MSNRLKWLVALVFLAFVIAIPQFVRNSYYMHLMILVMMNSVLAMTFILVLRTGLINMSVAAFWGIGAYSSGMLAAKAGLSFWVALPASLAIAALVGLIIGVVLVRNAGLGFVIPSLLFAFIVPLIFGTFSVFGGYVGLIGIPAPSTIPLPFGGHLVFGSERSYYYLLLVFAIVVVIAFLALYRAWTGRAWRALGLSSDLAESVGISPFRYRLLAFVIASVAAALMGIFFAQYSTNIAPDSYGPFKAIYVQMYAILGGVGSPIVGPLIGAGILTLIPEALRVTGGFAPILVGALIILILVFLPQGVLGFFRGRTFRDIPEEILLALGRGRASQGGGPKSVPKVEAELLVRQPKDEL